MLIVGEGRETEPNYFHGLKREQTVRDRFAVTVKKGNGGSTLQIVQDAVEKKNEPGKEYDETWCVLDVECAASEQAARDVAAAIALAGKNGISLIFSNPAFEVWVLAHFVRSSRYFNDGSAVIEEVNKHWVFAFGRGAEYRKDAPDVYSMLASRTHSAIANAEAVRLNDHGGEADIAKCNSATDVYRLVRKLLV